MRLSIADDALLGAIMFSRDKSYSWTLRLSLTFRGRWLGPVWLSCAHFASCRPWEAGTVDPVQALGQTCRKFMRQSGAHISCRRHDLCPGLVWLTMWARTI